LDKSKAEFRQTNVRQKKKEVKRKLDFFLFLQQRAEPSSDISWTKEEKEDPKKKQGKTMVFIEHCNFFWTSRDAWNGLHAKRGVSETFLSLYNHRQFTKYVDRIVITLLISYQVSRSRLSHDSGFGEFD